MVRVAGTDPGTSSLDVLILEDGRVAGQRRFEPAELREEPQRVVRFFQSNQPLDLIAGPSGYGLPLKPADRITESDLNLMTLVRPDDRGHDQGLLGFRSLLRTLASAKLPVVFLPGVVHLASVPAHRKINRIDLGTTDKLCVAALAVWELADRHRLPLDRCDLCVVELGSSFTAVLVVAGGRVVDGFGGTSGPVGWCSGGSWDGEAAYLLGPLQKQQLFQGGVRSIAAGESPGAEPPPDSLAVRLFRESLVKAVASARAISEFQHVLLSGRLLETAWVREAVAQDLARFGRVNCLTGLAGARVKHAAQGSAMIADGLAGGRFRELVDHLAIATASGTVLDGLAHAGAAALRKEFGVEQSHVV